MNKIYLLEESEGFYYLFNFFLKLLLLPEAFLGYMYNLIFLVVFLVESKIYVEDRIEVGKKHDNNNSKFLKIGPFSSSNIFSFYQLCTLIGRKRTRCIKLILSTRLQD